MRFKDYGKCGYACLSQDGTVLFTEDGTHNYLFEYAAKDLSNLSDLFMEYIRCKLDLETLDLRKDVPFDGHLEQIDESLKSVHPYFQHAYRETCVNVIGKFFNRLLLFFCYNQRTLSPETAKSKEWYLSRLEWLLRPFLKIGDEYLENIYQNYKKQIGDEFYTADLPVEEFEQVIVDVPGREPVIFSDEILTQKAVCNMLYFVLDVMAQDLSTLKTSQRVWLFRNIFRSQFERLTTRVERRLSFSQDSQLEKCEDCNQDQKTNQRENLSSIFSELHLLDSQKIENDGVPEELKESFCAAIDAAKEINPMQIYEEYEVTSLEQLLNIEIMSMIQNATMIRKCRNCGKYFVITNRNTAYCDRMDESGERCSAIGPSRNFQKKMGEEEALKIYTRAYKTHFARVKKGTMDKKAFSEWCKEAKGKLEQVRAGLLDIADFQKWLKH